LPSEDITNSGSTLNNNTNDTQNQLPVKSTTPTTSVKKSWFDDDDDDDEEDGGGTVSTPVVTPKSTTTTTTTTTSGGITLATIAKHNSRSSCWSAVNGGVYDLTSWIPNHPGGEQAILSMCGVDGSSGYNGQHGSSSKPARMLAGFKIGTLAK
jgi:cytochrome b involved in lipid metabolism